MGERTRLVIGLAAALVILGISVAAGKLYWILWALIAWFLISAAYGYGMILYHFTVLVFEFVVTVVKYLAKKVKVALRFVERIVWWLFAALMMTFVVLWFTVGGAWRLYLWLGLSILVALAVMAVIASVCLAIETIVRWFRRVNEATSFYEENRESLYRLLVTVESENTLADRGTILREKP